jgi:biotin carboxyl carrier protein
LKYFVTIDEQIYEVDVEGAGQVSVDGVEISADMQRVGRQDLYSLLLANVSYEVQVEPENEQRNLYGVLVEGTRYGVRVQDERSRRLALADRSLKAPGGELAIKAPIPGLVVKVAVEPGRTVTEGQTLIILEAMKMENDLRAPRDGVVHEVRVAAGAQVALGQLLVTLR